MVDRHCDALLLEVFKLNALHKPSPQPVEEELLLIRMGGSRETKALDSM